MDKDKEFKAAYNELIMKKVLVDEKFFSDKAKLLLKV
jgi:hypothetical protein